MTLFTVKLSLITTDSNLDLFLFKTGRIFKEHNLNSSDFKAEARLKSFGRISPLTLENANFSIDLPDATIAIQVSGAFGSRQEEAQRLGRILRPKSDGRGAKFYSVISRDTIDQDFAQNRQRFLAEQGYSYKIIDADDVFQGKI